MKKTLTFLAATTALTTAIGVPAWSAMQAPDGGLRPFTAFFEERAQAMPLILASDDDDEELALHCAGSTLAISIKMAPFHRTLVLSFKWR